jgi:hypothetical protein
MKSRRIALTFLDPKSATNDAARIHRQHVEPA